MRPEPLAGIIEPSRLSQTAGLFVHVFGAEELQIRLAAEYGSEEGMGAKAFWLVVVSMVVCVVGITNAMLVSVLERFREIATMKCLGAMDGLIATLFLLEAAFLGVVGGVAGVIVGGLIGLGRMSISYGQWVWTFFPAGGMLQMAGLSVIIGLLLTTLAAIYPAFKAAKMLPMEAMRVE
jgi:ABC-type antimicrobial peptide transport system permease subunit